MREFDVEAVRDNANVLIVGKRYSGKSFLARDLLWRHRDVPEGRVVLPPPGRGFEGLPRNDHDARFYSDLVPPEHVHDAAEFRDVVQGAIARQRARALAARKLMTDDAKMDLRAFLVLDNCCGIAPDGWRDLGLRTVFVNGRCHRLLSITTLEYPYRLPPDMRANIDHVFIMADSVPNNRKRIYEQFGGAFPSFEAFSQAMDEVSTRCAEVGACLVLDNTTRSNRLEDHAFWYRASEHPVEEARELRVGPFLP
jgi:hypothetical protein